MMHDDFFGSFDEEESILNFSGTVGFGMNFRFPRGDGYGQITTDAAGSQVL